VADRVLALRGEGNEALRAGIAAIQQELKVSADFPSEVEAAAAEAAKQPRLPDLDRTDLEFVTIDPVGSMDLDQAMHLERSGKGYVVHYAIADVAAFVVPDGPVDLEARRRGESLYGANATIPLHPRSLSEDATSLLPDQVRPAMLWTIELDQHGETTSATVERARVKSRQRLDYASVQKGVDDGSAPEMMMLLKEIGELRLAIERERGGVNLPVPEQEIVIEGDAWSLEYRTVLPVEDWNAQISLLTGFAAASIMMHGRIGILRTLPPPAPEAIKRLHRTAAALGVTWPAEQLYPDFIRALDPNKPADAAMAVACTRLLRGAGYVGFDGETPSSRSMPRWPPSTPTSPRRCVAWSIASGSRSAWLCAPTSRSRSGCTTGSTSCRRSCSPRGGSRTSTRSRSSTWSRRPSCNPTWVSPSRASYSVWIRRMPPRAT